jgi:hypothetical protein
MGLIQKELSRFKPPVLLFAATDLLFADAFSFPSVWGLCLLYVLWGLWGVCVLCELFGLCGLFVLLSDVLAMTSGTSDGGFELERLEAMGLPTLPRLPALPGVPGLRGDTPVSLLGATLDLGGITTELPSYRATELQRFSASELPSYRATELQSYSYRAAELQCFRASESPRFLPCLLAPYALDSMTV